MVENCADKGLKTMIQNLRKFLEEKLKKTNEREPTHRTWANVVKDAEGKGGKGGGKGEKGKGKGKTKGGKAEESKGGKRNARKRGSKRKR